jgi:membrane protein
LVLVGPTAGEWVAGWLQLGPAFAWTWLVLQWPVVFTLVATALALVYYFAPDVQQRLIWIMPGSVFATAVWLLASLGFKWYVSAFANFQETDGAIGGVMIALLWLYVSGLAILMGAEMTRSSNTRRRRGRSRARRDRQDPARAPLLQSVRPVTDSLNCARLWMRRGGPRSNSWSVYKPVYVPQSCNDGLS